jgi:hypothetical protein
MFSSSMLKSVTLLPSKEALYLSIIAEFIILTEGKTVENYLQAFYFSCRE